MQIIGTTQTTQPAQNQVAQSTSTVPTVQTYDVQTYDVQTSVTLESDKITCNDFGMNAFIKVTARPKRTPSGQSGILNADSPQQTKMDDIPVRVVLLIDNSGSMAGEKMDYIKATLSCIVDFLPTGSAASSKVQLCLMTFNQDFTDLTGGFVPVQKENLGKIHNLIESIKADGSTNFESPLTYIAGLVNKENKKVQMPTTVFMLTDGQANMKRKGPELIKYLQSVEFPKSAVLHTFGYGGAEHDSTELTNLAMAFGGNYHFVETTQIVPEIFGACMENALYPVAQQVSVIVKASRGCQIEKFEKYAPSYVRELKERKEYQIYLGTMPADTSNTFLIRFSVTEAEAGTSKLLTLTTSYEIPSVSVNYETNITAQRLGDAPKPTLSAELLKVMDRIFLCNCLRDIFGKMKDDTKIFPSDAIKSIEDTIIAIAKSSNDFDFKADLEQLKFGIQHCGSQVSYALVKAYFDVYYGMYYTERFNGARKLKRLSVWLKDVKEAASVPQSKMDHYITAAQTHSSSVVQGNVGGYLAKVVKFSNPSNTNSSNTN